MRRTTHGIGDWHVYNRGSRRMALFSDEQDARVFLGRMRKAAKLTGCVVWAYTLMTNHFHLVLRASSEQLARFMHHLQRLYSLYHNQRRKLRGHAFEGPYGAVRLGSPGSLIHALAYVFMNPVAAGLAARPEDWSWTSYRSFMGIGESRLWINVLPLLGELGKDIATARKYVVDAVEREYRRKTRRKSTAPSAVDVHASQFEWLLEQANARGHELEGWDPVLLALDWAKRVGVLRNAVARVLGGTLSAERRNDLRRFRVWLSDASRGERLSMP